MIFKELRELNALSVDEAAEILGVTAKTIYRWENGEIEPRKAFLRLLEERFNHRKKPKDIIPDFTFIDLFAGIGGIRKGFEAVNGKCVFTSEWDKYAQRTYRANFPDDHEINGDITKVKAKEGDILFFPAYLLHRAPRNKSKERKTVISFNCDFYNL